ncbi:hypothetical protein PybrP1_004112, partial [[Pythium] brassicae (nom. inval.)]
DDLIRDLERKVRRVVEQKRTESDKLRFAVTKKREEVERAKLILQDLIKESVALGLHYQSPPVNADNQCDESPTLSVRSTLHGGADVTEEDPIVPVKEEPGRLQPIASISRRPVYSKHSNINELEAKLEKRAHETHQVHRRTLVLEHIKKRLITERSDIAHETDELKTQFAAVTHETQELCKKEIAAAEAVSQVQARLAQQKDEIAANERKYAREVAMRQKWAREKAKFEKYYNDQSVVTVDPADDERELAHREAFLRIGFGQHADGVDPEEIIRVCLSHEQLKSELDAKHDEEAEMKDKAMGHNPLSKRGTSQKLETKELEISTVERSLATVVDQYMFVDQSVRPIKIGLQQILQNVTNETVNIDDMESLEKALLGTCEEMMRMVRESPAFEGDSAGEEDDDGDESDDDNNAGGGGRHIDRAASMVSKGSKEKLSFSADNFTSPFNIRVPRKHREQYFVPGISQDLAPKVDDRESEEADFDVMDRAMVKRIASVLICTSAGKKPPKDKPVHSNE